MSCLSGKQSSNWLYDHEADAWRREVIHSMLRRCRNWNYCGTGVYLITLVLNGHPTYGETTG